MIKGVVYKYISPDGNIYIGQTIEECNRRGLFFKAKHYVGVKIDNARRKFGTENFEYSRLHIKEYNNKKEAKLELDKIESHYINLYDSVNNGYNIHIGNHVEIVSYPKPDRIYKDNGIAPIKYPNAENGKKHKFKKVGQYDLEGNLLNTYKSISDASRKTNIHLTSISRNCNGLLTRVRNYVFKFL